MIKSDKNFFEIFIKELKNSMNNFDLSSKNGRINES